MASCSKSDETQPSVEEPSVEPSGIIDGYNVDNIVYISIIDKSEGALGENSAKEKLSKLTLFADSNAKTELKYPSNYDRRSYIHYSYYEINKNEKSVTYHLHINAPYFDKTTPILHKEVQNDTTIWYSTMYLKLYDGTIDTIYSEVTETENYAKVTKVVYNGNESEKENAYVRNVDL